MRKSNVYEFIEKAKKNHAEKYDYKDVVYINSTTKVKIICSKHGSFLQTPSAHLQGQGCRKCQYDNLISKNNTSTNSHITCAVCNINKPALEFNYRKDCMSYRRDCKECQHKKQKEYRTNNLQLIISKEKQNRIKNGNKIREREKKSKKNNRSTTNKNVRRKRKENAIFRLKETIRSSIKKYFKKNNHKKTSKTVEILGCTFDFFKLYIESKFEPWMNWNNHGPRNLGKLTWELDHIIPISSAKTKEDIIRLNHYTNFQPLESWENLRKSNKI